MRIEGLRYPGLLLIGLCFSVTGWAVEDAAVQPVERLHARLLHVMRQADELGFVGRRDRLRRVVAEGFDLPYICRLMLGRHWKKLDTTQRDRMVAVFTDLSVATYAARFDGFSGERFDTLKTEALKKGRKLVRTELRKADGSAVQLNYIVHPVDSRWKIVNVIAEGVSELSLKRAEYTTIVKKESFDALLGKLSKQVVNYSHSGG